LNGRQYYRENTHGSAALVARALDAFGRLDVLVNNAGAGQVADSETLALADWQRIIDLDLSAPFRCAQAAARTMLAAGRGVIVNVTSLNGHLGLPRRAAYGAAKHGLEGLTKTLAVEWARRGVRVVSVAPAYVASLTGGAATLTGDASNDTLIIGTDQGRFAYAALITGNVILGNSNAGGTLLDFGTGGPTNVVKLINGSKASSNPVGGGYFYVAAGALHWVGSAGTDTVVAPA